jgi:hypothetical protein
MALRRQFVLDRRTDRLLKNLAADRGSNYSRVVRDAVQALAEREDYLDRFESDPAFLKMMERSEKAFREGRFVTQEVLEEEIRRRKAKRRTGT